MQQQSIPRVASLAKIHDSSFPYRHTALEYRSLLVWKTSKQIQKSFNKIHRSLTYDFPKPICRCHRKFYSSFGMESMHGDYQSGNPSKPTANLSFIGQEATYEDMAAQKPVILLDIMGTIVRDPFYIDMPTYFGMSMKELLSQKHPTAWIEFESGLISETEMAAKFFADGREFDYEGLKDCMRDGYKYLEGIEGLLKRLRDSGYSMHAFTNYPSWFEIIEQKLQLSRYLSWTIVSCQLGKRKPDPSIYIQAAEMLLVHPRDCIFVDDREKNVIAATEIGMRGILFTDATSLEKKLVEMGIKGL